MTKFVLKVLDQEYFMGINHQPVVNNLPKFGPVLSAINTPRYNRAKFLIPILEPLTHNEFTIKDSFNFSNEITTYDSSLNMASLAAESLFTTSH